MNNSQVKQDDAVATVIIGSDEKSPNVDISLVDNSIVENSLADNSIRENSKGLIKIDE